MDPLVIVAGIPTALALFGVIRKNRMFFLTGYFLYALIVVPNEIMTYNATGEVAHLAYAFLWGVQAVLAFPNRLNYDGTKVFKSFGIKVFLSLSAVNLFGVLLVLGLGPIVQQHIVLQEIRVGAVFLECDRGCYCSGSTSG